MARKSVRVCVLASCPNPDEVRNRTCYDGSHGHIIRFEAAELVGNGEAEWLDADGRIIRLLKLRKTIRDKSAKLGEYLAKYVRKRHAWALVMEAEMSRRFEADGEVEEKGHYIREETIKWRNKQ